MVQIKIVSYSVVIMTVISDSYSSLSSASCVLFCSNPR